jgi:hypothetical protein
LLPAIKPLIWKLVRSSSHGEGISVNHSS